MRHRSFAAALSLSALLLPCRPAAAQTVAELQRQINELKALIQAQAASPRRGTRPAVAASGPRRSDAGTRPAAGRPVESAVATLPAASTAKSVVKPLVFDEPSTWWDALVPPTPQPLTDRIAEPGRAKTWFERLSLRGYTQLRVNEFLSGDDTAPAGRARLRSVHDGGISDRNNFTFRRVRVVLQGDIHERLFLYIQPDFAVNVSNQSGASRAETSRSCETLSPTCTSTTSAARSCGSASRKSPTAGKTCNRRRTASPSTGRTRSTARSRASAISASRPTTRRGMYSASGTASPRAGRSCSAITAPSASASITARPSTGSSRNKDLMVAGMATWPFELDALGPIFAGQVVEVGASAYRNRFQPEIRAGGVSPVAFDDRRVGLHAILYPQPFGLQAEWNWGRGRNSIRSAA